MHKLLLACVLLLAGTSACDQMNGGAKKADEAKTETDTASATKAEGEEAPKTECETYSEKVCEKVGAASPDCAAFKQVSALMPAAACKAGMTDIAFTEGKVAEARKGCTDLAEKLCKDLGAETESCKMVTEQTPKFPPARCTMMMEKYDEVLADLKKREDAKKPLDAEKQAAMLKDAVATFGSATAKVKLVEFSDFQCPFCSRAATATTEIKKKYGDKIQLVFRQFPLSFHKQAHLAAQASVEAAAQGKFWEFHDKLFENQRELERPQLEKYAKEVGLNVGKLKKALDGETHKAAVDADMKLGESVAVSGTPTLFLNGARLSNPTDVAAISKAIDEALAK